MNKSDSKKSIDDINTTLKFIELTKSGEYAYIDEQNLNIDRYEDDNIQNINEEEFFYSIS